jgi:two-component system, NarL family, nitrate/nitrite response regulator NarL
MPNSEHRGPSLGVFIADASSMGCELMAAALGRSRYRLSVAGCSTEFGGFRSIIEQSGINVDVAVISAGLKDGPLAGFRLARELRVSYPSARIIALLDSSERSVVVEAFRSGASGILSREQPFEILCKCIHAVYQGQVWASGKEMQYAIDALALNETVSVTKYNKSRTVLTKREEGVVRLVSEGFTNRDISQELKLSENTVRNYLFRIFNKVGASNRLELALYVLNRKDGSEQPIKERGSVVGAVRLDSAECVTTISRKF